MVQAVTEGASAAVVVERGLPPRADGSARRLSEALGVSCTLGDWLARRGFSDPEGTRRFLNPRLAELTQPDAMADRGLAADRLASALRRGERIAVFGDYDCDGMTSAAILTEVLRALGGDVRTLVASRFDGGYGLSRQACERVLRTSARLLVTCDCGSSDHEGLAFLGARGLDAIVIDHHLVPDQPLPVRAFLNPHRSECGFPYKGLASCGLVLSIAAAIRAALGQKLDLRRWLDLVAIGTIADVAPLDGDNRALVRAGLSAMVERPRPGLRALFAQAHLDGVERLSAEDVAFRIAPRLNAPGRLGAPDAALELLLATSSADAEVLAARIEQASLERKALQERMLGEALEEIRREGHDERAAIVLGREGWNHGVVGIVAGRLAARFERPVVMLGFENGRGRGSVRGPEGARLYDALARSSDSVVRFGGHQAAAGLELQIERLGDFRAAFEAAVQTLAAASGPASAANRGAALLWLAPEDAPARVLSDFALLEPCGATNPAPELLVDARVVSAREVTGGHLKLELELDAGHRLGAFGVEMGNLALGIGERVIVAGRLRPDRYRGGGAVEMRVERVL